MNNKTFVQRIGKNFQDPHPTRVKRKEVLRFDKDERDKQSEEEVSGFSY